MKVTSLTRLLLLTVVVAVVASGCSVYFNTFFNAKKAFNEAEKARTSSKQEGSTAGKADYQKAIEKATKVVENFPNSKYYDDAVRILAISYYHTEQFSRAERRFRELLADFPESEWVQEAQLYLAKARLRLGELDDANVLFQEIFDQEYPRQFKAEAAVALGEYSFDEKDYEMSRKYMMAVRDSLGDDQQKKRAQMVIADSYFEDFKFRDALGGYLQVLGMNPDKGEKYHATYMAAIASYRLLRIDDGLAYLQVLIDDDEYYDSLGILRLTVAEGLENDDDLVNAEATYLDVIKSTQRQHWKAEAYYRLGLIYQFDYDKLQEAKEYYDQSAAASKAGATGADALQRSSDIGKLAEYALAELDSTADQAAIDDAGYTQYRLSELYWFNLNKPDSAIAQMQYLLDHFPSAYCVPKGMIALSQMYREHRSDTAAADSLLRQVVFQHPHSDYVPEALELLGLKGTAADTGYAERHIQAAERFLIDQDNVDSALAQYQTVVDRFPDSKYHLGAKFATIYLTEMYRSPGDSSVILAYEAFADSFAGTEFAREATRRIGSGPASAPKQPEGGPGEEAPGGTEEGPAVAAGEADSLEFGIDADRRTTLYYPPNGDTLVDLRLEPIETLEPFVFPVEYVDPTLKIDEWPLYFQIQLDNFGKVINYKLHIPSGIEEIDERAKLTVSSMTFDAADVENRAFGANMGEPADGKGHWFVYMYLVEMPAGIGR